MSDQELIRLLAEYRNRLERGDGLDATALLHALIAELREREKRQSKVGDDTGRES